MWIEIPTKITKKTDATTMLRAYETLRDNAPYDITNLIAIKNPNFPVESALRELLEHDPYDDIEALYKAYGKTSIGKQVFREALERKVDRFVDDPGAFYSLSVLGIQTPNHKRIGTSLDGWEYYTVILVNGRWFLFAGCREFDLGTDDAEGHWISRHWGVEGEEDWHGPEGWRMPQLCPADTAGRTDSHSL